MLYHETVLLKDKHHKEYFQDASVVATRLLTNAAAATASYDGLQVRGVWYIGPRRKELFQFMGTSVDEAVRTCLGHAVLGHWEGTSSVAYENVLPSVSCSVGTNDKFLASGVMRVREALSGGGEGAGAMAEEVICAAAQAANEVCPPPSTELSAVPLPFPPSIVVQEKACSLVGVRVCRGTRDVEGRPPQALCVIPFVEPNCSLPAERTRIVHTHIPLSCTLSGGSLDPDCRSRSMCVQVEVVENVVGMYGHTHTIVTADVHVPVSRASTYRHSSCVCNGVTYAAESADDGSAVIGVFVEVTVRMSITREVTVEARPLRVGGGGEGGGDLELSEECDGSGSSGSGGEGSARRGGSGGEEGEDMRMSDGEEGPSSTACGGGDGSAVVCAEWVCDEVAKSYKARGNDSMRRHDYYSAVEYYSYAIAANTSNGILYSNR